MDVKERGRESSTLPQREKHSKVAYNQESQKAQPKRGVVKGRSGEPSKC